jgi:hypothetical protein
VNYSASDPGTDPSALAEVDVDVKGPTDSGRRRQEQWQ